MLRNVFLKSLRDLGRAFFWWSLGLVGLVALMVSVYPSVRDNEALNKLVNDYPAALKGTVAFGGEIDYVSAAGYLGSELFSLMVPLLLLVAAIGARARAIAGEEERGTLDLLLAHPMSRRRVVLEKLAALIAELVGLGIVLFAALEVGSRAVALDISASHLAAATAAAVLLAISFGGVAFSSERQPVTEGGPQASLRPWLSPLMSSTDWLPSSMRLSPYRRSRSSTTTRRATRCARVSQRAMSAFPLESPFSPRCSPCSPSTGAISPLEARFPLTCR